MNIKKQIKKAVKRESEGYRFYKVRKGVFKVNNQEIITPVLEYRKDRYSDNNVDIGYYVKTFNRFGLIQTKRI